MLGVPLWKVCVRTGGPRMDGFQAVSLRFRINTISPSCNLMYFPAPQQRKNNRVLQYQHCFCFFFLIGYPFMQGCRLRITLVYGTDVKLTVLGELYRPRIERNCTPKTRAAKFTRACAIEKRMDMSQSNFTR